MNIARPLTTAIVAKGGFMSGYDIIRLEQGIITLVDADLISRDPILQIFLVLMLSGVLLLGAAAWLLRKHHRQPVQASLRKSRFRRYFQP